MRIASGTIDQAILFEAEDVGNPAVVLTGLSGFVVKTVRNDGVVIEIATPMITEVSATDMPGIYSLLLDMNTTIDAGNFTEELLVHITHQAMKRVVRHIELFAPSGTLRFQGPITAVAQQDSFSVSGAAARTTNAYKGCLAVFREGTNESVRKIVSSSYDGANVDITIDFDPDFGITTNTYLTIVAPSYTSVDQMDMETIRAQTDQFIFDASDNVHAHVQAGSATLDPSTVTDIADEVTSHADFQKLLNGAKFGTVNDASPAAGDFDGDAGLVGTADWYNGAVLAFIGGSLQGIARKISDYTADRNLIFNTAFPSAPANGDPFMIVGRIDG